MAVPKGKKTGSQNQGATDDVCGQCLGGGGCGGVHSMKILKQPCIINCVVYEADGQAQALPTNAFDVWRNAV